MIPPPPSPYSLSNAPCTFSKSRHQRRRPMHLFYKFIIFILLLSSLHARNQHKEGTESSTQNSFTQTTPDGAVIVCSVDGTVYTIDAYTGTLRGLFTSGPALVSSSTLQQSSQSSNEDDNGNKYKDEECDNSSSAETSNSDSYFSCSSTETGSTNGNRKHDLREHSSNTCDDKNTIDGKDKTNYEEQSEGKTDTDNGHGGEYCHHQSQKDQEGHKQEGHKQESQKPHYRERIVPGLDGRIYTLTEFVENDLNDDDSYTQYTSNVRLNELSVSVMDVTDSPVSTCRQRQRFVERHNIPNDPDFGSEDGKQNPDDSLLEEKYKHSNAHQAHTSSEWVEDEEECGIVMGEKRSKMFALDILSGSVSWMQYPSNRQMGFTTSRSPPGFGDYHVHNNINKRNGKKQGSNVVLLQRDDYFVRHVDINTGEENWNVTVGSFSALDFPDLSSPSTSIYSTGLSKNTGPSHLFANGMRAGVASPLIPPNPSRTNSLKRGMPFRQGMLNDNAEGDDPEQEEFASMFDGTDLDFSSLFPSIAFGQDGKSLLAVDPNTEDILWKKKIDSVIAAVYGVGKSNSWVSLNVVDEEEILEQYEERERASNHEKYGSDHSVATTGHRHNLYFNDIPIFHSALPYHQLINGGTHESSALVPYENGHPLKGKHLEHSRDTSPSTHLNHRSSTLLPSRNQATVDNSLLLDDEGNSFIFPPTSPLVGNQLSDWMYFDQEDSSVFSPRISHKTEHGIFLTWQVLMIVLVLLISTAACGRLAYLKQKQKWENAPKLSLSNSNSLDTSEEIANTTSKKEHNWTHNNNIHSFDIDKLSMKGKLPPPLLSRPSPGMGRSYSLGHLNADKARPLSPTMNTPCFETIHSVEPVMEELHRNEFKSPNPLPPPPLKSVTTLPPSQVNTPSNSTPSRHGLGAVLEAQQEQKQSLPDVVTVDGIPLVRYSRYKSEFNEFSPLGKGGFGTVFRCENALDGREYAVKKIRIKSFVDSSKGGATNLAKKLQRVLREVKILALLDHPNIVRYYTAWLELETSGKNDDDISANNPEFTTFENESVSQSELYQQSNDEMKRRGNMTPSNNFSSYLLKKNRSSRFGRRRSNSDSSLFDNNKTNKSVNPLGWNNFLGDDNADSSSAFDLLSREDTSSFGESKELTGMTRASASFNEDLGFFWDRGDGTDDQSSDEATSLGCNDNSDSYNDGNQSKVTLSVAIGNETVENPLSNNEEKNESHEAITSDSIDAGKQKTAIQQLPSPREQLRKQRHLLYIQMQLCSQKTLIDFLASPETRKGLSYPCSDSEATQYSGEKNTPPTGNHDDRVKNETINIPYALQIFGQIARGVKHVHKRGLIHRDLKPSNCFIDDTGTVKIGDFGLSRESATGRIGKARNDEEAEDDDDEEENSTENKFNGNRNTSVKDLDQYDAFGGGQNNTAGVGTRSYASPEQMNGSDYDASTDVYSLGVMIFELCYPMYTGMERHMMFKDIRKRVFPAKWHSTVAKFSPSLHDLVYAMLSPVPSERPSSHAVAEHIDSLLGQFVFSLDRVPETRGKGSFLLRVEAVDAEGILPRTIKMIKEATPRVRILQYGLKGQDNKAILEFALSFSASGTEDDDMKIKTSHNKTGPDLQRRILSALNDSDEIMLVREVSDNLVPGRGTSFHSEHGRDR